MSGRGKKIPCPFSSSKKPKRSENLMELRNSEWNELCATVARTSIKMNAHFVPRFSFICLQAANTQNTGLQGPLAGPYACSTLVPRQNSQLIHDPRCFQNPQNPSIYGKNLQPMRFLRSNPSMRKPIHPPLFMSY